MTSPDEIKKRTEDFLADNDSADEEAEIPTQYPTQTQDSNIAYPLGQPTQTQDTNPSVVRPYMYPLVTHQPTLLSQLSAKGRQDSSQQTTGFTQLEEMMRMQSQAQQAAYVNYPPHINGVPFGGMVPPPARPANATSPKKKKAQPTKKAVPKKKATEKKGTQEKKAGGRGPAFKESEAFALLDIVEQKNTIAGRVNWDLVCFAMEGDGWPKRGVDATKRRYWEIINKAQKMPTGDPDVPKLLIRAREVHYSVRANNGVGDPSEESAAIEGEIQEITEGATGVRNDQVLGEGDLGIEDRKPQFKTPTNKSFIVRRQSSSAKGSTNSVFDAIAQLQASQIEEARRQAKQDRREKREQNKLWLRIAAIGAAAFMSQSADEETKKTLQKDILKQVINLASDDEEGHNSDDSSSVDLLAYRTVSKKKRTGDK